MSRSDGICLCILAFETSAFTDDVFTKCADCGIGIRHRPHAPAQLDKVCLECGTVRLAEQAIANPDQPIKLAVTPETRREVRAYFARRRH